MKKESRILMIALMLISVISFSYQTSFGSGQFVNETNMDHTRSTEQATLTSIAGVVTAAVGAAYIAGYYLGRAYGHYRYGEQEMRYSMINYSPTDFSAFDK